MVDKVFNTQIMEVYQGSDLGEIIDEMLAHMRTQVENLALENSRIEFHHVLYPRCQFPSVERNLKQFSPSSPRLDFEQESSDEPEE